MAGLDRGVGGVPAFTWNDVLKLGSVVVAFVVAVWVVYSAVQSDLKVVSAKVDEANKRIDAQQIEIAIVRSTSNQNKETIIGTIAELKTLAVFVRDRLDKISDDMGKLREDFARNGIPKGR